MRSILVLLTLVVLSTACAADTPQRLDVHPVVLAVEAAEGSKRAEFAIEIARSESERSMGLMFRRDLPKDRGMLFVFDDEDRRFFWMKNTPTALDIIYA
ncbi:MAG: DUF192 domain-containing protein, partial [Pseudomonadota bacterium]